jgi:hypothetical protein
MKVKEMFTEQHTWLFISALSFALSRDERKTACVIKLLFPPVHLVVSEGKEKRKQSYGMHNDK